MSESNEWDFTPEELRIAARVARRSGGHILPAAAATSGSTRQNGCSGSRYYMERPTLMSDSLRDHRKADDE